MRSRVLIGGILLLAATAGPAAAQTAAEAAIPPTDDVRQRLGEEIVSFFFDDPTVPVVHLDAAAIDSVGTMLSDANLELLNRIDRAYREGHYGPPDEKSARKAAFAAFVYNAQTAFDFFTELSLQHEVIYSTSEEDLKSAFTERYRNPGLYPIVNLKDFARRVRPVLHGVRGGRSRSRGRSWSPARPIRRRGPRRSKFAGLRRCAWSTST